jgi:hypothetical protein
MMATFVYETKRKSHVCFKSDKIILVSEMRCKCCSVSERL